MKDSLGNCFVIGNYVTFPDVNIITDKDFEPFEHPCIKIGKIVDIEQNENGWQWVTLKVFGDLADERGFFPEEIFCVYSCDMTDEKAADYNNSTYNLD